MGKKSMNPLPDKAKKVANEHLLALCRDLTCLFLQVKMAHWNLRSPSFIAFHELLDEIGAAVQTNVDEIAERARQLGSPVSANTAVLASSPLGEFPATEISLKDAVEHLGKSFAAVIAQTLAGIEATDEAGDPITADLLTQVSGGLELNLWKIESHLE